MNKDLREKLEKICGLLRVKPEYNAEAELLSLFQEENKKVVEKIDKKLVLARCITETSSWGAYRHIAPEDWDDLKKNLIGESKE